MTLKGSCHCGRVAFEINGDLPPELTRCTCSFCSKRGMLYAYFDPEQFHLTTPEADLATYRWRTKLVAYHFCPVCGCGTHSDSPDFEPDGKWDGQTRRIGINARLFENFDAAEYPVRKIDGRNLW